MLYGLTPGLELLRLARDAGVREITYYGFTTDNCGRPTEQVRAFSAACVQAVERIATEPVSLLVVGNRGSPVFPRALLPYGERRDLNGGGLRVNFLVNYGWEWDLAGLRAPAEPREDLRPAALPRRLTGGPGDPVGRDAAAVRLSAGPVGLRGLFVVDRLWPDFQPEDFEQALRWYQKQDVTRGG